MGLNKKGRSILYFSILGLVLLSVVGAIYALAVQEEDSETQTETSSIVSQINGLSESSSCNFNDPECTDNGNCFCDVNENEHLQFGITFSWIPPDPERPACVWSPILPPGATFPTQQSLGQASSTFDWTPLTGQAGNYLAEFHGGENCFETLAVLPVRINVNPVETQTLMCGDIDGSGTLTSADIIKLVNYVFRGGPPPDPLWTGDTNGDGRITSADIIYLVNHVFRGGPAPNCKEVLCCSVDSEECGLVSGGPDGCYDTGGFVSDCIPDIFNTETPGAKVNYTTANANNLSQAVRDNITSVYNASVRNQKYNATSYDCDDFASDFERNLTTAGFNATYTLIWRYNATGSLLECHALTDIHVGPTTVFVEPQTGAYVDLDCDGDGKVETTNGAYVGGAAGVTDDNCKIGVYDNIEDATANGNPID